MDAKSFFFNCEERDKCYTSNCRYFARQIHRCTQNNLWTSSVKTGVSFIYQDSSIMKILNPLLSCDNWYIQGLSIELYVFLNKLNGVVKLCQFVSSFEFPWKRKTKADHPLLGKFLIHLSFDLHISVVYQVVCIFSDKVICKIKLHAFQNS